MHEIINLQIGKCGNNVGTAFWKIIAPEHGLTTDGVYVERLETIQDIDCDSCEGSSDVQRERLQVYFKETLGNTYARTICAGLSSEGSKIVRASPYSKLFQPENLFFGADEIGAGQNWARGNRTLGPVLADKVIDAVRKEAESCDSLQGFQITHSLGGGDGGGTASHLLSRLREEFPDRMISTFSIIPSAKVSSNTFEGAYNAVLTMRQLTDKSDQTFCIDNEALHNICLRDLGISRPELGDLNYIAAGAMSSVTTSLRFPNQLNASIRELNAVMVPTPRLHFFQISCAPYAVLVPDKKAEMLPLFERAAESSNFLTSCGYGYGELIACSAILRGAAKMPPDILNTLSKRGIVPKTGQFQISHCPINVQGKSFDSVAMIHHTTSVEEVFQRLAKDFDAMYRRKALLHSYTDEGMDESDFTEARSDLENLIKQYQDFSSYLSDEDEGEAE